MKSSAKNVKLNTADDLFTTGEQLVHKTIVSEAYAPTVAQAQEIKCHQSRGEKGTFAKNEFWIYEIRRPHSGRVMWSPDQGR